LAVYKGLRLCGLFPVVVRLAFVLLIGIAITTVTGW
jgi:hypothetical protein